MNAIWLGILLPFVGTTLGAACVFFMRKEMGERLEKTLAGFAGGVMIAASVWSLLIPAMDMSSSMGKLAFIPAVLGFVGGMGFLLALDCLVPHLHVNENKPEGLSSTWKKTTMLLLAVTLHNIPEGMAVGVVFAGMKSMDTEITLMNALALSIGIAIQNFPEGAIISMPLNVNGTGKGMAFMYGTLSGIVEPLGALITLWLSGYLLPVMPYLLSFAAGAMIYVVVEELIPQTAQGKHTNLGTIGFAIGFSIMMILDVALG